MRKLTVSDASIRWVQPDAKKRFFELRAGDDVVAMLSWEKMFGTLATAQTPDGTWTFKRVGFFNPRVTVRSPGSDADLAVFKPSWGYGGTLETAGRTYTLKKLDFWGSKFGITWPDGTVIVSFGFAGGLEKLFRPEGIVDIAPGSVSTNPDLPLLITLGWYLTILMHDESVAVTAAVT